MDPTDVSVFTVPDGSGDPLSNCFLLGARRTDATISLQMVDDEGDPVPDIPAEDMWLETTEGGLVLCPDGSIADGPTDQDGRTTFSSPVCGGGASDPTVDEVTAITVGGCTHYHPGRTILFNSPDLNGDLVVNLSDIILFARIYWGEYSYAADFYWDGQVNLSDLAMMIGTRGRTCP